MPFDRPDLQLGDSGKAVTRLQEDLVAVGCFADEPDGEFGQPTMDAVIQFQEGVGLTADGVVNADTWAVLEGPEATVDQSIDLKEFPSLALAMSHGSDETLDDYLAEFGIEQV